MPNSIPSKSEHKFTFGLWTVGNTGGDPFGEPVRPLHSPVELVQLLAEVGAYGVNLHDNDLVPLGASPAERDRLVCEFKQVLSDTGLVASMGSCNMFADPVFKDGAFTSNDASVRAYALQKTMRAIDMMAELGVPVFVFWGGREGTESDATKNPQDALKHMREALNFLCEYVLDQDYEMKFALEPKPNEPRGDIYLPTTGSALGFIETLDHSEVVGVNPEMAHEQMAGLNFLHAVAQAWDAGKLFHIDLNDQNPGRYDQDFRFASHSLKQAFFLVHFLEDVGYNGPLHYDAHAYRTEDMEGVKDFARGCMRSYLALKEKAQQFSEDEEIQTLLAKVNESTDGVAEEIKSYDTDQAAALKERNFDSDAMAARGMSYERLDQLVFDLLMGLR